MKDTIKILIALAFILGSYFLGNYQAEEKYSIQLKEANEKLSVSQSSINQLKDSINSFQKLITKITFEKADTVKTKSKLSEQKAVTKKK